ncbi:hypothetical protein SAMN05443634_10759 [Chishuiella changwenlii]|uniref:C1q domain-containing protein n=1 Tax=Chishuiella changwenlii TaxID=1434701 RepID=A0A1M6YVX1_9FLAO|nr:hypothetical protein [Chishuiella changwenlii]GGE88060.1 hypothetical protein GCM10010984_02230 [Chishuiella changwenlii]SHL22222.1 hypothetical protein SAMN05443634_10759 [Chishuiella changwenlii]
MKANLTLLALALLTNTYAQVGINTSNPTSSLDVNGNARVRQIDDLTETPEYLLTADEQGNIKKVETSIVNNGTPASYSPKMAGIFRLTTDVTCSTCDRRIIPFNQNVVSNDEYLQINSNGVYTILSSGLYQFTVQVGVNSVTANSDIIIGILNTSGNWIGRATFSTSNTNRQFRVYTTTLQFNEGDRFSVGINMTTGSVQGTQTGTTGNGNVTNFSVVKY